MQNNNLRGRSRGLGVLVWMLMIGPIIALAQQSTIDGRVTDSSSADIVGADISLRNVDTGESWRIKSDGIGQYAVPDLKPGNYQATAEKQGFARQTINGIRLEVQTVRTVNFVLAVGTVTQLVTVSSTPTALQTSESSVSTMFESKLVEDLPLNGRDFLQLQLLSPGTAMGVGGTFTAVQIAAQNMAIGGGNFSVNGMRDVYNDYLIDGISFKDWMHGTNGMNPSVDAVREFRLQTSNWSAEYGSNAGGLVNMITKSGTNQVHGLAYDYLRNDALDATNLFTKIAGQAKTPLRRNQFGGTLGGPFRRNKNFWFGSYEGFRQESTSTLFDTFPTAKMKTGDFSELLALPQPILIHDPATGIPYPGNVIPPGQILSVMPDYLTNYVPLPNRPGLSLNFVEPGTDTNNDDQVIGRIDQVLKNNIQLSGHYILSRIWDYPPTTNSHFFITQHNNDQNAMVEMTDSISPNTVLDLQAGWNAFKQYLVTNTANTTPNISTSVLHISGVATDPRASGTPFFLLNDFGTVSGGSSAPRQWITEHYVYQGNVTMVRGRHIIEAGLQTVREDDTFQEIYIPNGLFVFSGIFTGYDMADMMLGIPSEFQMSPQLFNPLFRNWYIMPWIQDDWRITPKLTLNLGIRYEWRPWPVSKDNTITNIILPPGGNSASLILAGPCTPNPAIDRTCATSLSTSISPTRSTINSTDKKAFAPRVGFAYQLGKSNRTVVRGGYGIFYQAEPFNQFVFLSINPPFVSFYDRFNNSSNYKDWDFYNPLANQPPGGIQFTYIPQNSSLPYLQAWNLSVQRDLGAGFVLTTAYVGSKDTKLWARTWPNQPPPGPGDIQSRRPYTNVSTVAGDEPVGNASYNGLQVKLEKRYSQGLSMLAGYTWSKGITDSQMAETGYFVPDLQDNSCRRCNRGPIATDVRHRFTLSSVYELPIGSQKRFLSGSSGVIGTLVSGWQVGGIVTVQTGQPLTATLGFDNPNVGEGAKLPNVIHNPNNGPKTISEYFDTTAFVVPPPYTFGNEGINSVRGPGLTYVDFSAVKNTHLFNESNLQFRAEFFNLFNHSLLGMPNSVVGTPTFGQITSTALDNRQIQLALRLSF
jgi:Carboxypeptidase regulatory-like domain